MVANSNLNSGNQQSYAEHEHLALISAGPNNTTSTSYGDTTNQWQHIYGNVSLANVHRHKFTLIDIYWPISPTILLLLLLRHGQQQLLCQKSIAAADFRELAALFSPCVVDMRYRWPKDGDGEVLMRMEQSPAWTDKSLSGKIKPAHNPVTDPINYIHRRAGPLSTGPLWPKDKCVICLKECLRLHVIDSSSPRQMWSQIIPRI